MRDPTLRRDALLACALALVLGAGWTWMAWSDLIRLRLPDTDDIMRLQQVRDWLGGQRWSDLTQHRLGPAAGVPMHWSRLADLAPAALIATLSPLAGPHMAEVWAVIAVPIVLFGIALFLVARIARTLAPDLAATATAVAALAYPATTVFLPGRIDHHGLQLVLLLIAALAAIRPASDGGGIAIGLAAAASLVIGLETAPVLAAIGAAAAIGWAWGEAGAARRLAGLGVGALVGLGIGRGLFRPDGWAYPACDGFTALAWQAALPLAALPVLLAAADRWLPTRRGRSVALVMSGVAAAGAAVLLSPQCLAPYGGVDPIVARGWLARVGEAQSAWQADPAAALAYLGLALAGVAAAVGQSRSTRRRDWLAMTAILTVALILAVVQLRGAYAAALLAAPGLAAVIAAARRRGIVPLAGAWAASAGLAYPIAAQAVTPAAAALSADAGDCLAPGLVTRLARLPRGAVLAPIDAGPVLLAETPQRVIAAPYHRDGAGLRAALTVEHGTAAAAAATLAALPADYLVRCGTMPVRQIPGWRPIAQFSDGAAILARDTLSRPPSRP